MPNDTEANSLASHFKVTERTEAILNNFNDFLTPLPQALEEISERRKNIQLHTAVFNYLQADIPSHFLHEQPILYLSRHLATPNFESLKFIEVAKPHNLPIVIGEDSHGKFTSINESKKSLGKMSIVKGMNRNRDEIIENFTIVDFGKWDGSTIGEVVTNFNKPLTEFHHGLFTEIYPKGITIVDEAAWIDRHHRNDILEQYKHLLVLLLLHGIMCEVYYQNDLQFVEEILKPAFTFVVDTFGHRPLIHGFVDGMHHQEKDLVMYPSVLYPFLDQAVTTKINKI
jgi:hypothetical protein